MPGRAAFAERQVGGVGVAVLAAGEVGAVEEAVGGFLQADGFGDPGRDLVAVHRRHAGHVEDRLDGDVTALRQKHPYEPLCTREICPVAAGELERQTATQCNRHSLKSVSASRRLVRRSDDGLHADGPLSPILWTDPPGAEHHGLEDRA